ncbi:MAG: HAD family hydrolase [Spirochaetota bacterium]
MKRQIAAVGFDIDGTLYPEWTMYACSLPAFFRDPLVMYHYGRMRKTIRSRQNGSEMLLPENQPEKRLRTLEAEVVLEQMGKEATPEAVSNILLRIEQHLYTLWQRSFSRIKPFDGVVALFSRLQQMEIPVGLLSDFPPGIKPRALGVSAMAAVVCGSEESGRLKPDVAPFRMLADRLGVQDYSTLLYVGNSYSKDIIGAKQAGMQTAYFVRSQRRAARESFAAKCPSADFIFSRFSELEAYILAAETSQQGSG